jgi:hypothetical protein
MVGTGKAGGVESAMSRTVLGREVGAGVDKTRNDFIAD